MPCIINEIRGLFAAAVITAMLFGCRLDTPAHDAAVTGDREASDHTAVYKGVTIADNPPDYESDACMRLSDSLLASGVSSVAITPCGYLDSVNSVNVRWIQWSKRDYVAGIRRLKQRGFTVLLKPYLWSKDFWTKRKWTGDIAHSDSSRRKQFFASYKQFMLDNARFAQEGGADVLCVGLELPKLANDEYAWRDIIADVRRVYSGKLTYAAHGLGEARQIKFWDALDIVGINAYPTLSDEEQATEADLERGSKAFCSQVGEFWEEHQRPNIVFTEVGFRSVERAWYSPWEWPEHAPRAVNLQHQALAYRVFGRVITRQPWFGGVYWWKVFTDEQRPDEGPDGFTPQGKPAWQELRAMFQRPQAR